MAGEIEFISLLQSQYILTVSVYTHSLSINSQSRYTVEPLNNEGIGTANIISLFGGFLY